MISKCLQILGLQPWISKVFSWSLEQFFLTIGQNNFGNKISLLICPIRILSLEDTEELFINPSVNFFKLSSSMCNTWSLSFFSGKKALQPIYLRLSKKIPFKLSEIQYLDEYSMNTCLSVRRGKAVGLFISKFEMNAYHISETYLPLDFRAF